MYYYICTYIYVMYTIRTLFKDTLKSGSITLSTVYWPAVCGYNAAFGLVFGHCFSGCWYIIISFAFYSPSVFIVGFEMPAYTFDEDGGSVQGGCNNPGRQRNSAGCYIICHNFNYCWSAVNSQRALRIQSRYRMCKLVRRLKVGVFRND